MRAQKPRSFLWTAHPARALAEAWAVALLVLLWLSWLKEAQPEVIGIGLFFMCGLAGMWAVLRAAVPGGSFRRQGAYESGIAAALGLGMALTYFPARLAGLPDAWAAMGFDRGIITLLLAGTGVGYLGCRVLVRLWLAWDHMRRTRMRWALTHAHLLLVVLAAAGGALALLWLMPFGRTPALAGAAAHGWLASAIARFFLTIFPALSLVVILTVVALAIVLPPSALFSFLVARQTTRRLEALAQATAALRGGDYDARVVVGGEDELAQLQADFNAMADTLQRTLGDLQNERDNVATLLAARRELVAGVSHELRTPVATVRATLDSVLDHWHDGPPSEAQHDLEVAACEILRLQGLIDDLFTLSRAEVDALSLEVAAIDAGPALRQMADALAPLAWANGRVEVVAACRRISRPWTQTVTVSNKWWPTCCATPCATPRPAASWSCRPRPRVAVCASTCAIPAKASPPRICPASGTVSTAARAAAGRRTAPGWAWPWSKN